jgi:hypothetical protein
MAGLIATVASEVIQYIMIYQKTEYKQLKEQIEVASDRLQKQKD